MFALGQQMSSIRTRLPASPCTCCRFCCGAGLVLFSRILGSQERDFDDVRKKNFILLSAYFYGESLRTSTAYFYFTRVR